VIQYVRPVKDFLNGIGTISAKDLSGLPQDTSLPRSDIALPEQLQAEPSGEIEKLHLFRPGMIFKNGK